MKLFVAQSCWQRAGGLLTRPRLLPDEGLWLKPCRSIHTFGMKYEIALFFLDQKNRVIDVHTEVKPNRLVWSKQAYSVVETLTVRRGCIQQALNQLEAALSSF
jgi:uncharacterized protein